MLADPYDAILLDLDGVLYRWPEPIEGAADAVQALRDAGKRIAFVTNNSSRTPGQVVERLASVGVDARPEEIVTSALATATLLAERSVGSAFVVGEEGLLEAIGYAGIRVVDAAADEVDVVVVGFDRGADYTKLKDASVLVVRGASLVASNADPRSPRPAVSPGPAPAPSSPRSRQRPARGAKSSGSPSRLSSSARSPRPGVAARSWSATGWTPTSPAPRGSVGTRRWSSRVMPVARTWNTRTGSRRSSSTTSPAWCDGVPPGGTGVSCRRTGGTLERSTQTGGVTHGAR